MEEDIHISKETMKTVNSIFEEANKKYREENPCPRCGSHEVGFDITFINGPHSGWIEWCNSCGWKKRTES